MMRTLFLTLDSLLFESAFAQISIQPMVSASWNQSYPFCDKCGMNPIICEKRTGISGKRAGKRAPYEKILKPILF